ncbi:MAG: hypothetical protein ABR583_02410 [Gaiellaceae bacterium]
MAAAAAQTPRELALIAALQRNRGELAPAALELILQRLRDSARG